MPFVLQPTKPPFSWKTARLDGASTSPALHGTRTYRLLCHTPTGRCLAGTWYSLAYTGGGFDGFFIGEQMAEAEAHGAFDPLVGQAHGLEDGGGKHGASGAGGAGGAIDAGEIEADEERFAGATGEGEVEGVGQALVGVAIDNEVRDDPSQGIDKEEAESVAAFVAPVHFIASELEGSGHADGEGDRFGAGSSAHLLVSAEGAGNHAVAAVEEESTDAEGAMELMGGKGEGIDPQVVEADRDFADSLGGVAVEGDGGELTAEVGDVLDGAGFVVGELEGDAVDVAGDGVGEDVALGVDAGFDKGDLADRLGSKVAGGFEDGGMFDGGDEEGRAAFGSRPLTIEVGFAGNCSHGEEGEVVGFGGTAGEEDFVGMGLEQISDGAACGFEGEAGGGAGAVGAGGVAHGGAGHGFGYFREQGCGAVVVEVEAHESS